MKANAFNGTLENQSAKTNREACQWYVDELVGGVLERKEVGEGNMGWYIYGECGWEQ